MDGKISISDIPDPSRPLKDLQLWSTSRVKRECPSNAALASQLLYKPDTLVVIFPAERRHILFSLLCLNYPVVELCGHTSAARVVIS